MRSRTGRGAVVARSEPRRGGSSGFSYTEVLVASLLLAVSLVPALEALQTATLGSGIHASRVVAHRLLTAKMEEVLAERFASLEAAEVAAGGAPTAYSDPVASPDRRLVYLSRYDGDNADADGDFFTGTDDGLLWVRVEIEGTSLALESLTTR